MFLEIVDIIHLILHQRPQTLNSNKNKNMNHIYWFDLQSAVEEFPIPTFIVRRLLEVKKRI